MENLDHFAMKRKKEINQIPTIQWKMLHQNKKKTRILSVIDDLEGFQVRDSRVRHGFASIIMEITQRNSVSFNIIIILN